MGCNKNYPCGDTLRKKVKRIRKNLYLSVSKKVDIYIEMIKKFLYMVRIMGHIKGFLKIR